MPENVCNAAIGFGSYMTDRISSPAARCTFFLFLLLIFGPACHRRERFIEGSVRIPELNRGRWIEPRLAGSSAWARCTPSLREGRILQEIDCGDAAHESPSDVSQNPEVCEMPIATYAEAIQALVTHPSCTDAAIERLSALANDRKDAGLASDLAAAYYVRAHRDDQLVDLLRSIEAAQKAVSIDASLPAAQFNLALAQESLGFSSAAHDTWRRAARLDSSPWSVEAAGRANAIERAAIRSEATRWSLNQRRLSEAEMLGVQTVEILIRPYPAAAQRDVEEAVLPAWGAMQLKKRPAEARRLLGQASVIAEALWKATGDPYVRETVHRIEVSRGETLRSLARAHVAFGEARAAERAHNSIEIGRAHV